MAKINYYKLYIYSNTNWEILQDVPVLTFIKQGGMI